MVKKNITGAAAPPTKITDERFASFETDPRFRLPSRKHAKTTLDKRFSGMLKDNDFTATARVDRYGRRIKSDAKKKALERLYQLEEELGDDSGSGSDGDASGKQEEDKEGEEDKDDTNDSGEDEHESKEVEVEDDDVVEKELRTAGESFHKKYDPAREGGFSSSEDEDSDEDDADGIDGEDGEDGATKGGDMRRLEREEVEIGEVTKRIAIVNLDWDHVKSTDLMALFTSFIPTGDKGTITNIAVYPSEFGKERMQQEELEGPPRELFGKGKKNKNNGDDNEDDESASDSEAEEAAIKKKLIQEGNDQDFDSDALRAYQLDRLRYYYAVMSCSSKELAKALYDATDGTEYQSSSNVIDLRFVPDEVAFDDEPRDKCDRVPESYRPIDFVTNALQSSKVKLTWDMHPEEMSRKDSIKRAFKGSRAEIDEQDLKAYLAGDSSDSEAEEQEQEHDGKEEEEKRGVAAVGGEEPKLNKKELARKKMREALGLADEPTKKAKDGPVGDMEVTFTPALSGDGGKNKKKGGAKKDGEEETTIEKYARKERERKEKKRQAAKAKREGADEDANEQEGFGDAEGAAHEDLGFDDPFFTIDNDGGAAPGTSKTSVRKEERRKKREAREAAEAKDAEEKAHLAEVMAQDRDEGQAEHLDHFNMNDIMRAEKLRAKKGKAKGKKGRAQEDKVKGGSLQEDFRMDVRDERFKAVFDSHEFAIDPSNPRYKATEGMKKLLEEGRKKRKGGEREGEGEEEGGRGKKRGKKARR
ncbi:Pre-rRNA-processing protein ESF1 [Escovopsis weberi]|uniref:Pre-rRNA-processing protein ESF1 n=1 Tax=Escovopsis weberi TaxID=150374 RepID=A0A0M9VVF2_ESCWE|nr:Pre-rRNA-processing protein ESF1 [Escovopsis weberi]